MSEEKKQLTLIDVKENGETSEINIEQEKLRYNLSPERVLIIVREDIQSIYFWKGSKSSIRKRYMGSRICTRIQGELIENGADRYKIVTEEQGEESEEFLRVFGLEAKKIRQKEKEQTEFQEQEIRRSDILKKKLDEIEEKIAGEIQDILEDDEKIIWIKSYKRVLEDNWLDSLKKDSRYKDRLKKLETTDKFEGFAEHDDKYVITNKKMIVYSILNHIIDYSKVEGKKFKISGEIAELRLNGIHSFDVVKNKGRFDISINVEPLPYDGGIFIVEDLSEMEYNKFLDIFTTLVPFRAEIPENVNLRYTKREY